MEYIDSIYFINLDHRTDRLKQFEEEMKRFGIPTEKLHRISGIYKPEIGELGCSRSHIKALSTFLESPHKNCIIFEDDFIFNQDINYSFFLLRHLFQRNQDFDLVMLAGNIMKEEQTDSPFLHRVLDGQTTSAYLLTKEFATKLLDNFTAGADKLEDWFNEHKSPKHEYCLDIYWKELQVESKWFVIHPKLGYQRESYSDIQKKILNYGV